MPWEIDDDLVALKKGAEERLFSLPGVHSVGLGPKIVGGQWTERVAIQVTVERKRPAAELAPDQLIPARIGEVPTDVVEEPPPELVADCPKDLGKDGDNQPYDVLHGGCMISSELNTASTFKSAGTLGCFGETLDPAIVPPKKVAITASHVLASMFTKLRVVGTKVGQPEFSACDTYVFGRVLNRVELTQGPVSRELLADAGTIELIPGSRKWIPQVESPKETAVIDKGPVFITGTASANIGDTVFKHGKTSGCTRGKVIKVKDSVLVVLRDFGGGVIGAIRILDTIWIEALEVDVPPRVFACNGDSGAAVLNAAGKVVGVLCVGSADAVYGRASPSTL